MELELKARLDRGELDETLGLLYGASLEEARARCHRVMAAFETAFVFLDSDDAAASAPVPPWAMKVVLDETFVLEEEPL